jgi:hypothetical protein
MREVHFDDLANVMESWEKLRTKSNYEKDAGNKLCKQ